MYTAILVLDLESVSIVCPVAVYQVLLYIMSFDSSNTLQCSP